MATGPRLRYRDPSTGRFISAARARAEALAAELAAEREAHAAEVARLTAAQEEVAAAAASGDPLSAAAAAPAPLDELKLQVREAEARNFAKAQELLRCAPRPHPPARARLCPCNTLTHALARRVPS